MAEFGGVQPHPTLADKAAAYLFFVAQAHAFADGNKRVAVVAAITFLEINGYTLDASIDEFEALVFGTAKGETPRDVVSEFFRSRVVPRIPSIP